MKHLSKTLLILLLAPFTAEAHGPTPQKAKEQVTINASVDKTWEAIKQFDTISSWHPDVKASSGDGKNAADGTRTLTLQNGEQIVESLDYYSDKDHEYNYRLKTENVKALPVSSYTNNIQVTAGDDTTSSVVTVKSRFYRGDTGNTPPETLSDPAAVKAMNAFFKNGLEGLKKRLEK
ncbi:MAG: SRPBCC family protein [Methylococcaceae bacterium]|nr:SRPBCC family protein [Methylococcaceae bacterium]